MNTQLVLSNPQIIIDNGKALTTSKAVAEYFGKQHQHVTQRIEKLDCSPSFASSNFSLHAEKQQVGVAIRDIKYYQMTKDGFTFLAMGFTGKKAARFKEEDKEHAERTLLSINNQKQKY